MPKHFAYNGMWLQKMLFANNLDQLLISSVRGVGKTHSAFAWMMNKYHNSPFYNLQSVVYVSYSLDEEISHIKKFKEMYWGDIKEPKHYATVTNKFMLQKERYVTFADIHSEYFQNHITDGILCNWTHYVFDDVPLEELRKFDVDLKKAKNILVIGSADRVPV